MGHLERYDSCLAACSVLVQAKMRAERLLAAMQVKIAEHVLTQHKVAIKILNKRKIKQQDMEEKGMLLLIDALRQWGSGH